MAQLVDQYRKRLETKEKELNTVNELNLKLKEKILEFQSFNQQNVDNAKSHIAQLNDDLGEKVEEIKERVKREKEMAQKIKKIQTQWQVRENNSQQIVFEEKAMHLRDLHLKRRYFNSLMRNILICACARRIQKSIATREKNYLKHVSFLCLKQEMVLKNHIRKMEHQRQNNLLKKALFLL